MPGNYGADDAQTSTEPLVKNGEILGFPISVVVVLGLGLAAFAFGWIKLGKKKG